MKGDVGVAWWTQPDHTPVYLIVDDGRVTACTPFAEPWALGRTAGQLLARGEAQGATVEWIPLSAAPTLFLPHLVPGKVAVRRWEHHQEPLASDLLTLGRLEDGGWYVADTAEPKAWRYRLADEAWAECWRRMRTGRWVRIHAASRDGRPTTVDEDPPLPDGLSDA